METATLRIHINSTSDALPIVGANVHIQDKQGNLIYQLTTQANGDTEAVELITPSSFLALNSQTFSESLAVYDVEVTALGFMPKYIQDLQFMGGQETLLWIDLQAEKAEQTMQDERMFSYEAVMQNSAQLPEASDDFFVPLHIGSTGDRVRQMQKYLNDVHNLYPFLPILTVDGVFDPAMQNTVMLFQRAKGLRVSGVVDAVTFAAL